MNEMNTNNGSVLNPENNEMNENKITSNNNSVNKKEIVNRIVNLENRLSTLENM